MSRSPAVVLYDANGQAVILEDGAAIPANQFGVPLIAKDGSTARVVAADASGNIKSVLQAGSAQIGKVVITDGTNDAEITPDGRFQVEEAPPTPPAGTTEFTGEQVNTRSSAQTTNFNIPVGEVAVIQRFIAGCEGEGGKGSLVRLRYDQAGGGPVQDLEIARIYVLASTTFIPMNFTAPRAAVSGDRFRITREPLEGSTQEIYGRFEGYY